MTRPRQSPIIVRRRFAYSCGACVFHSPWYQRTPFTAMSFRTATFALNITPGLLSPFAFAYSAYGARYFSPAVSSAFELIHASMQVPPIEQLTSPSGTFTSFTSSRPKKNATPEKSFFGCAPRFSLSHGVHPPRTHSSGTALAPHGRL